MFTTSGTLNLMVNNLFSLPELTVDLHNQYIPLAVLVFEIINCNFRQ